MKYLLGGTILTALVCTMPCLTTRYASADEIGPEDPLFEMEELLLEQPGTLIITYNNYRSVGGIVEIAATVSVPISTFPIILARIPVSPRSSQTYRLDVYELEPFMTVECYGRILLSSAIVYDDGAVDRVMNYPFFYTVMPPIGTLATYDQLLPNEICQDPAASFLMTPEQMPTEGR